MPRHARVVIPGLPLHIRHRGVNRGPTFLDRADCELYLGLLEEVAPRFDCGVHAYVLMPNHVHLLATADDVHGAAHFMKGVAQRYSQHFNRKHRRCGPLWEGRFRSSVVDSTDYLLTCYRYVELNPVRAQLVHAPQDYEWSSYRANALGRPCSLVAPHFEFLSLGDTAEERRQAYLAMISQGLSDAELGAVREAINANAALGTKTFVKEIATRTGKLAQAVPRGRPKSNAGCGEKESVPG